MTDEVCQCPKCGRSHHKMPFGRPPPSISGELSYDEYCRLSRLFNEGAHLGLTQDRNINEWLKTKIAKAAPPSTG